MVHVPRWVDLEGLPEGSVPANALKDFVIDKNSLSVYLLPSDKPELAERVAIAMAAGRQHLDRVTYLVFDVSHLEELNLVVDEVPGRTPDAEVNKYHADLVKLRAEDIVSLAHVMLANWSTVTIDKNAVRGALIAGLSEQRLSREKCEPSLLERIQPVGSVTPTSGPIAPATPASSPPSPPLAS